MYLSDIVSLLSAWHFENHLQNGWSSAVRNIWGKVDFWLAYQDKEDGLSDYERDASQDGNGSNPVRNIKQISNGSLHTESNGGLLSTEVMVCAEKSHVQREEKIMEKQRNTIKGIKSERKKEREKKRKKERER